MAVADRDDALGSLAGTFQRMASDVRAREDALQAEVRELRIENDALRSRQGIPRDRPAAADAVEPPT